jgi:hypothetical protein
MPTVPHNAADIRLAPVLLALDGRIEEMAQLDLDELWLRAAVESDSNDWSHELRVSALMHAIEHFIDTGGWALSWDPRGLRVSHGQRSIVLGVPATFPAYIEGGARARRASAMRKGAGDD